MPYSARALFCLALFLGGPAITPALAAEPIKSREFWFTYETTVVGLTPGDVARVWLPVPPTNEDQTVRVARWSLPARSTLGVEPKYGNSVLFLEAAAPASGEVALSLTYQVLRREARAGGGQNQPTPEEVKLFLDADARVPVGGKSLGLLRGKQLPGDPTRLGRLLYDVVNDHMEYSKAQPGWGRGDSEWACDSKFGNCSDFHSLFISLARAQKMPAKFEMGFPLPEARGQGEVTGYHCWAKFAPRDGGWIPVDISEANKVKTSRPEMVEYYFGNLTENRVAFSVGRDLTLVPPQAGEPLNFFIYPYVEVGDKPLPDARVKRKFTYQDAPGK